MTMRNKNKKTPTGNQGQKSYYRVQMQSKCVSSSEESEVRRMALEGILAIQEGNSPRVVEEKLRSFMPPIIREQTKGEKEG